MMNGWRGLQPFPGNYEDSCDLGGLHELAMCLELVLKAEADVCSWSFLAYPCWR